MKRSRYEQLQSAVSYYLKRRQYSEAETAQKKECKGRCNLEEMALKNSLSGEITTDNTLTFSSISGDATVCEQQYSRFKNFVQESSDPLRTELQSLLFPLFVHIYLELLCNGHKTPAHKFFNRHSVLFRELDKHNGLLEAVSKLYSRTDVTSCKEAQDYRDFKYKVELSSEAQTCLNRYIKNEDNMIMLQICNQHLKIKVNDGCHDEDSLQLSEEQQPTLQTPSPPSIPDSKDVHDDHSLSSLQQVIQEVRDQPPCLPSICYYTFLNAYQGLCCVGVSSDKQLLSAGFEDSSIKLWRLTPGVLQSQSAEADPSLIYMSGDYLSMEDEEEEEKMKKSVEKEVLTLRSHSSTVYQTCFTADSKYLLSCSEDTTVRLWSMESYKNVVCYRGHNYPVWDLDTSCVGYYFASASQDQTAKLWCIDRNYPLRSFVGHTYDVDCVKFHPNGNYVATGSGDKTVRLWSVQEGKSVRLLQGHKGSVLALAFSQDGKYLSSAGDDRRVRVWDLGSGTLFKEFRGHTDNIHALSFSKDSSTLASGGLDCCIRVWDVRKSVANSPANPVFLEGHTSPELLCAFPTKSASVIFLDYSQYSVLWAAGAI
ncbi:hypothetical protein CHS0354_005083 [Potamilus streckersoni]|uniref:TFIID subunit TAF5 NTD2 domain-containing protein n=1 Tax=Potamilus streckersoni TaxID=2493646 RepID=A0AAE0SI50_9BIVA|nr:hypothetical protein CHS0354_005083 [Potamilus streckersoni]